MITELNKRHPSIALILIWLCCGVAGVGLPKVFGILDFVDKWLMDLRLTTIGAVMKPRSDIVLLTITEDTLANYSYRFPVDRGMLADAIDRLNKAGARAIGLDVLFDQPTEPEKDRRLADAVSGSAAPVVVGWASQADGLTQNQAGYLRTYLRGAIQAPSNLTKDERDGTVRWIFPGIQDENAYRVAFAPALAKAVGVEVSREPAGLYFRRGQDGNVQPFTKFPLHMLKDLPAQWFAGKIVLIGADLPNEDRHRTPFSAIVGSNEGSLPGVVVHAFSLAQLLDGAQFEQSGLVLNLILAVAISGIGILISLLEISVVAKLVLAGLTFTLLWGGGFTLFSFGGALIPLFTPSLTFAGAAGISGALMSQRYRQKKLYAEAMVQRRNHSLQKMVENSFDGIVVTSSDGIIVSTNTSADNLMGWSPGEMVGAAIVNHIPEIEDIAKQFLESDARQHEPSASRTEPPEMQCHRRDGTPFTMEVIVYTARVSFEKSATIASGGERVSYIYAFRDVTARRLEQEARENALRKAEASDRAKTEFLANMSHELRTPLNAILGFSELMKTQALGPLGCPQYLEYMEDIYDSGNHLIEIVNDILDMSKIEAGELNLNESLFDFARIADTARRLVADRACKAEVKLELDLATDLPRLFADERMIKQILLNLLSNAVKFTPTGGCVTLRARADIEGLMFTVSDTGIGIPADKMEIIMQPFGQADMTLHREYEGTGLGLPLVKGMTELHGGTFDIQSTEGTGTTTSVWLPPDRINSEQKIA